MKFERIIEGKDHLWAVRDMNKPNNELAALFQKWNDAEYLWDFFLENQNDELFIPLSSADMTIRELAREKARNWNRTGHASWLRVYAIRLEKNVFVITGGAIKLTRTMQERSHTQAELDKLNQCRQFLASNGVFDSDSFISMIEEDNI